MRHSLLLLLPCLAVLLLSNISAVHAQVDEEDDSTTPDDNSTVVFPSVPPPTPKTPVNTTAPKTPVTTTPVTTNTTTPVNTTAPKTPVNTTAPKTPVNTTTPVAKGPVTVITNTTTTVTTNTTTTTNGTMPVVGINDPLYQLRGDVVVIHGFGGSQLVNIQTNQVVWITQAILQNQFTPKIFLDIMLNFGDEDPIVPNGFLESAPWNPFYTDFLRKLASLDLAKRIKLSLFAYDWRRDTGYLSALFQNFLLNLYGRNGRQPITVFAHDMGGLLTMQAIHAMGDQASQVIRGVVFAGTAFSGSAYGLAQQWTGLVQGINTSILDYQAIFLMRSAFVMPCFGHNCVVDARTNKYISLDLYDPQTWIKYKLAKAIDPFYNTTIGTLDARTAYLTSTVLTSRLTRDAQYAQHHFLYPPFATICGDTYPTAASLLARPDAFGLGIDYTKFTTSKGDGVVTFDSCQMQPGIPYTSVRSNSDHFGLLNDSAALAQALSCIFT